MVWSFVKPSDKCRNLEMVTARDGLIDKMKGQIAGTNKYLTKPFQPEELLTVVGNYIKTYQISKKGSFGNTQISS
jgi:DNA-binding response OmpR family regulator